MIVSKASNSTEATSSKTLGLLETGGSTNNKVKVVTEGLLSGLNTSTAVVGNPVWLGTSGNLIYGLANKPVAPAHLVSIGVVTRVSAVNGEIFVKPQNGFELFEIHDVTMSGKQDGYVLSWNATSGLYEFVSPQTGPTGATGPQGPQGLKGDTGDQGIQGLTGATGPQGPIGLTGATGATGPQGPAGTNGLTGDTGPQGPIGLTGATGPQGLKGDIGTTGATGPQGPQGIQGNTGSDGQGFLWRGAWATGSVYAAYDVVRQDGSSYRASSTHTSGSTTQPGIGSNWTSFWSLMAQKGDTGTTGATGATGSQGLSGVISVTSPITNTGSSTSAIIGINQSAFTSLGTSSPSFDLVNTNATTINFGGAATTLNIGKTGLGNTVTIGNALAVTGRVLVGGGNGNTGLTIEDTGELLTDGAISASGTVTGGNLTTSGTLTRTQLAVGGTTTGASINASGQFIRTSSSARYKQDIEDANFVYEDVLALAPKTFRLKEEAENDPDSKLYGGLLAEDVDQIQSLKVFVNYMTQEDGSVVPDGVAYGEMVSALVSALKHQDTMIKALETRLDQLENL